MQPPGASDYRRIIRPNEPGFEECCAVAQFRSVGGPTIVSRGVSKSVTAYGDAELEMDGGKIADE